jgi:hypothetical protein
VAAVLAGRWDRGAGLEGAGRGGVNRLKRIQYRPELITGFLAQTGLSLEPEPP